MTASSQATTEHDAVTLDLAKKESAEHMAGMVELYESMRQRRMRVRALALDDNAADPCKIVHLVRHGQGFHNLMADMAHQQGLEWKQFVRSDENPYTKPELLDAPLTEKGRQQAIKLQTAVAALPDKPQLVVCSPNCRALQTGLLVWQELVGVVPFVAHELAREETGVHVCDKRRPVSLARREFPQVDFSLLQSDEDMIFSDDHRESKAQVGERIYGFLEWLSQRPETHVAINSHSGWLLTLLNGVCESDASLKGWFQTGEMRSIKMQFIHR